MKKLLLPIALMLTMALSVGSALAATAKKPVKTLKIGMNAEFKPFEFLDEKGKVGGFDAELALAIGKEMGYKVEFVNVPWDGIIPGLINKSYDCIMSAMTITDERSQTVNFSDPYFKAGQVIVVKKTISDIKSPADLKGKKVSVQISTTGDFAAEKAGAEVKKLDNISLALIELKNGNVDASVVDIAVAGYTVKGDKSLKLADAEPFTSEYYGVAFRKADKTLLKAFNTGLAKTKANGVYDKIYSKWFGSK